MSLRGNNQLSVTDDVDQTTLTAVILSRSPTYGTSMAKKPRYPARERFVDEYLVDLNATQAAIRAGYSKKCAGAQGHRLLKDAEIQAKISEARKRLSDSTQITAEAVLKRWWDLANADAAELSQFRRLACRRCHGIGHQFQWIDEAEWAESLAAAQREDENAVISNEGGYGYKRSADPHPKCPHCEGEGEPEVWFADTRKLSPAAAALFDGVKQTQSGMEIKTRDRDAALLQVAKHLGMFVEQHDHKSSDGSMTPKSAVELTDEQLARIIADDDKQG